VSIISLLDWLPRKGILAGVFLLFAGFSIPGAMCIGLIPINFLLAFVGLTLAAVGEVLLLIRCGEI
jgi:type IV secretory pathway VirB3-like protein